MKHTTTKKSTYRLKCVYFGRFYTDGVGLASAKLFTKHQRLESPTANGKRESVIALTCEVGAKGAGGGGEGEKREREKGMEPYPLSTIPLPFSLSPTPCLLMFTATYFYKEITKVS